MTDKSENTTFRLYSALRTYAEGIVLTIVVALLLRLFVLSPYRIPNEIMAPTVRAGDFIMGFRLPYGIRVPLSEKKVGEKSPRRGDLVIFPCPSNLSKSCLRRVIGLPGDRIEIQGERLVVNGVVAQYQPIATEKEGFRLVELLNSSRHEIFIHGDGSRSRFGPAIVGPQSVFVLSDHRGLGEDSRDWGGVKISSIEARAAFIWFSWNWPAESHGGATPGVRWERVFRSPD